MKSWIKEGIISGFQGIAFFCIVCLVWALIIKISQDLGISPAWSILTVFVIAIFSVSLAAAKVKHDLNKRFKNSSLRLKTREKLLDSNIKYSDTTPPH